MDAQLTTTFRNDLDRLKLSSDQQTLLRRQGFVCREKRPNGGTRFKLRYRDRDRRQRVCCLGADPAFAEQFKRGLKQWQAARSVEKQIRRELRKMARDRQIDKRKMTLLLEFHGYRFHGTAVRRRRAPAFPSPTRFPTNAPTNPSSPPLQEHRPMALNPDPPLQADPTPVSPVAPTTAATPTPAAPSPTETPSPTATSSPTAAPAQCQETLSAAERLPPGSELFAVAAEATEHPLSRAMLGRAAHQERAFETIKALVEERLDLAEGIDEKLDVAFATSDKLAWLQNTINQTVKPAVQIERDLLKYQDRSATTPRQTFGEFDFPMVLNETPTTSPEITSPSNGESNEDLTPHPNLPR